MQRFLVTGANKGIGLAIVKGLLEATASSFVFLGSRDLSRGQEAAASLICESPAFSGRVEVLQIDVSDGDSVKRAAETVRSRFDESGTPLTALVNNAGIISQEFSPSSFEDVLNVNFRGVVRATEALLPLLDPSKGRVVMVSSGSGPMFVSKCSPEREALMIDPSVTQPQIMSLLDECTSIASSGGDVAAKFAEAGLSSAEDSSGYGLSKALVNMYTMHVARENPSLLVNACTPGFIVTDLARSFEGPLSKSVEEMGGKPPAAGAKVPVFLAVGHLPSSGWYYGSDGVRSPLHRYRSPGEPGYTGDAEAARVTYVGSWA